MKSVIELFLAHSLLIALSFECQKECLQEFDKYPLIVQLFCLRLRLSSLHCYCVLVFPRMYTQAIFGRMQPRNKGTKKKGNALDYTKTRLKVIDHQII